MLDGRALAEEHRHRYDRRGRLIRTLVVREPLWTEQDRAELLALALHRESLCPCGCGHPYSEVTSAEDGGPQYAAERVVCRARLALNETQNNLADEGKQSRAVAAARLWSVRKVTRS